MLDQITYMPLDAFRYESELRHLVNLAKTPGFYDFATKKSRELAEREPSIYGKLPSDLWVAIKEK